MCIDFYNTYRALSDEYNYYLQLSDEEIREVRYFAEGHVASKW